MRRKSHKRIAKSILPGADPNVIDEINRLMDQAGSWIPSTSSEFGRVPGIDYKGHRRRGHDISTVIMAGLLAGYPGLASALTHLGLDALRDLVRKRYGTAAADILEGVINLIYEYQTQKAKKRSEKQLNL